MNGPDFIHSWRMKSDKIYRQQDHIISSISDLASRGRLPILQMISTVTLFIC